MKEVATTTYGLGSISQDPRTGRWQLRVRVNGKPRSKTFATEAEAKEMRDAIAQTRSCEEGITLRQWGDVHFEEYAYSKSIRDTWDSLVCKAPFIDYPLQTITANDITGWTTDLLIKPATRSVLRAGKRTLIELDHPISRNYGKQALSILRTVLNAAKNRKPQLIENNPAADIEMPKGRDAKGKIRTKRAKRTRTKLDYLPAPDCDRVFWCEDCDSIRGVQDDDLEVLVECPHVPFMYRVAMSTSVMQGLRQGEIASQRWERITWSGAADWTDCTWLIETSWDGDTKSGQDRVQALIPMAARLLDRWRTYKGNPTSGLLFAAADAMPKHRLGELARFVVAHPTLTNHDLVVEATRAGLQLTLRRAEALRSEARRRVERRKATADKMFARGYDFGWSDTPYTHASGELRVKPGWVTKLRLTERTRFHDFRDTAATHLLSGTWGPAWDIYQVSEFLGHSDIKVTQDRYAHLTTAAKTKAAAGVNPTRAHRRLAEKLLKVS